MTTLVSGWFAERTVGYNLSGPRCAVWQGNIPEGSETAHEFMCKRGQLGYSLGVQVWISDEMTNHFYKEKFGPALRNYIGKLWTEGRRGYYRLKFWTDDPNHTPYFEVEAEIDGGLAETDS